MIYDEDYKGVKMGHHKVYITPPASTIDRRHEQGVEEGASPRPRPDPGRNAGSPLEVRRWRRRPSIEVDVKKDPEVIDIKLE